MEFEQGMTDKINRRGFIKTSVAGSAGVLMASCDNDPVEELIPLLIPPDDYVPGEAFNFATVCQECPAGCGMVIRTREGRAVKAEGNPAQSTNGGALCAIGQASLQGLYNPMRTPGPFYREKGQKQAITWEQGITDFALQIRRLQRSELNSKIVYFSRPDSGTLPALIDRFWRKIENAQQIKFDMSPINSMFEANSRLFNQREIPFYAFDKARTLVNFGADFMESWGNPVEQMAGYGVSQTFDGKAKGRSYYISPLLSLTGTNADFHTLCRPGDELSICLSIVRLLVPDSNSLTPPEKLGLLDKLVDYKPKVVSAQTGMSSETIKNLAAEIGTNGDSLVIGGGTAAADENSTHLQEAIGLLNWVAGNIGRSVVFGSGDTHRHHDLKELPSIVRAMERGEVGMIIFDNVNPVYALPESSGFQKALPKVPAIINLSTIEDETSQLSTLHLPISHFLECWGDLNPRHGSYRLQQPVMSPVPGFDTIPKGDLFLKLGKILYPDDFESIDFPSYLKNAWKLIHKQRSPGLPFEQFWQNVRQSGGIYAEPKAKKVTINLKGTAFYPLKKPKEQLTLLAVNSLFHHANGYTGDKYWLYEIPDPVTQVVWDNCLQIHPETAAKLGIKNQELVEIANGRGSTLKMGALIYPGINKNCIAIQTGYGRKIPFPDYTHYKRDLFIPTKTSDPNRLKEITPGVNVAKLLDFKQDPLSGDLVYHTPAIIVKPLGIKSDLVTVDGQFRRSKENHGKAGSIDRSQKGRGLVRSVPLSELRNDLKKDHPSHQDQNSITATESQPDFYPSMQESVKNHPFNLRGKDTPDYYQPYRWEMTIDLDRCTGCSACVVACYAENNIAVVGKERQAVGREMAWLRIERYFDREESTGRLVTHYNPQMCNQCENAGCEPVCPLFATYHNPDGINAMVYARCAGTRYCANNCIYKSRRFNWRTYLFPDPLHMQLNPDVTVRSKGVMEKCTFCIQRIKDAKELAKREKREVRDDEIRTACQQTCPTNAIRFGNGQRSNTAVSLVKNNKRAYQQLEELNFKPSITYLKKVIS